MRPRLKLATLLAAAIAATPATALADTFVVREGSMSFDTGDPASFVFRGNAFEISGLFQPIATSGAFTCAPVGCVPGTLVNVGTVFGGETRDFQLGLGTATIDGVQFGSQTGPPGEGGFLFLTGTLSFVAPDLPLPTGGEPLVRLTAPFLFTGNVIGSNERPVVMPLFDLVLTGAGTASMRLDLQNGIYQFTALEYVFDASEPVPEPATLLLVGSGLAGLVRRRTRAR